MTRKPLLVLTAVALTTAAAHAQQSSSLSSGVSVGYYFPSNSIIKGAFGSQVLNYGLGGVGTNRPSSGSITPDLEITNANENGNALFIGTYTMGYEYHFTQGTSQLTPYVRGFGGASYFDFGVTMPDGTRNSLKRLGYTYGAEVGLVFLKRYRLAARYNIYSSEQSLDFNGLTVDLTWALW